MPPIGKHVREAMADDLPCRVGSCDLDRVAALGTVGPFRAIAAHLGLSEAAFRRRYCAVDDGYTILRIDEVDCPFLAEGPACSIYPVRPIQCSAWPFWRENLDDPARWHGPVSECCPGIGQGEHHSAEEIDRRADEVEEWYEGE